MKRNFNTMFLAVFACSLAFVFTACDDDSSGTSAGGLNKSDADFIENEFDDLPECVFKQEGAVAYVEGEDAVYVCENKKWVKAESSNEKVSSANEKKSSVSDKIESSSSKADEEKYDSEKTESSSSGKSSSSEKNVSGDSEKSKFNYGTLIDERDGQKYKTIKIGKQNWMAENLNFDYNKGSAKSYCYDDKTSNCDTYGRLYTWAAAVDSAAVYSTNSKESSSGKGCGDGKLCHLFGTIRGVCPEGWHLPKKTEMDAFFEAVGGKDGAVAKLKSTSGWLQNGEDTYGFAVLPAGDKDGSTYEDLESYATFWNAHEGADGYAENWYVKNSNEHVFQQTGGKGVARSVRCVEDTVVKARFEYGSFTDERDGQTYKTVKIGTQTWMAENLNFKSEDGYGNSYCYDDDLSKCSTYGRLYDWLGALHSIHEGEEVDGDYVIVQGVCPEDWHLPTEAEVTTLREFVDANKDIDGKLLKSLDGWWNGENSNGTDEFGFSALPSGKRTDSGNYDELGYSATFWSWNVAERESKKIINATCWYFENIKDYGVQSWTGKDVGRSVRCVKNSGPK